MFKLKFEASRPSESEAVVDLEAVLPNSLRNLHKLWELHLSFA